MADGSGMRRDDADRALIAGLICIATSRMDDPDRELALHVVGQVLPLTSKAPRIEALRDAAVGIVAAAPHRRKRGDGALNWVNACLDLDRALARDAIRVVRFTMEGV
jgi:hypothetical protein